MSCSKSQVHQAVASWAGVLNVNENTALNGLGGKQWPQDAPPLIETINGLCGCSIPPEDYQLFTHVADIDEWVGAK
ncbi:hypothetical protein GX441_00320 [bacterium]|nr:hypothetical protein [bacterium]